MESGSAADWFSGVASALAVIVALAGYWLADWQRRKDLKERERGAAQMIGVKLLQAFNRTAVIHKHLWPVDVPKLQGDDGTHLWRHIQPLAGLQDDPSAALSEPEINLLIAMNAHQFLSGITMVIARYQSLTASMREYGVRYGAMMELTPAPDEMRGKVAVVRMDREQYMKLIPYTLALEGLLQSLRELSAENLEHAKTLCRQYNPMMKAHFKATRFLSLGIPDDNKAATPDA
jgi:hypothetical protein